ncbi:Thiamin biosynthesis lipoprotein ApbE [Fimbriiglobus ruber]|uniref:FAD:protein FMN transferase n=1 Tax=Fimbriiglobus ruber TaxID=1908690 RepID=A0A225DJB2_9BACT|nr:Thiamin biosynthesis lipoprotein ApbE [Fimbriiglobus ruber]
MTGAAGALLVPDLAAEPALPGDLTLLRVSRRAMATTFEVAIPYGTADALPAAEDALDLIDDLEDQLTVYRDHSEVSRLNTTAADGPVEVEPRLFDLLSAAATLTRDTAGAFDCATGALIKVWGFHKREGRVPPPEELRAARECSGTRHVVLDPAARTIKFRKHGLEINLGGIGKGYALDRAGERLREKWGITSALLQGGGSSVLAIGAPPTNPRGWAVAVRHPWDDTRTLGTVWLKDQGFGTSAATFQFFEYNGRKLGHLLDPRTGWPADGTAGASVVAPTAAAADALSTALFVYGIAGFEKVAVAHPNLGAIVLPDTPGAAPVVTGLPVSRYDRPGLRETVAALFALPD